MPCGRLRDWLLRRARRRQLLRHQDRVMDLLRQIAHASPLFCREHLGASDQTSRDLHWMACRVVWPMEDK